MIGRSAFVRCASLEAVSIPASVDEIGECAFLNCTGLKRADILNGDTVIGEDAFGDCPNLVIHAPAKSRAEKYARKNGIRFEAMET